MQINILTKRLQKHAILRKKRSTRDKAGSLATAASLVTYRFSPSRQGDFGREKNFLRKF